MIDMYNLHRWASSFSEEEFIEKCKAEKKISITTGAYLRQYYVPSDDNTLYDALIAFYRQQNLELNQKWRPG